MDPNTRPHDPDTDNRPPTARDLLNDALDVDATGRELRTPQEAINIRLQFATVIALVEISEALHSITKHGIVPRIDNRF